MPDKQPNWSNQGKRTHEWSSQNIQTQSREPHLLSRAFCVFVRPSLEYCCVIWNPIHKYNITKINAVQWRFTKRLHRFYKLSYENRLSQLGLENLTHRRVKIDLVVCYKILRNLIDSNKFLKWSTLCHSRGNCMEFNKPRTLSACDSHFFTNRVINTFNSLPNSNVTAYTVNC